MILTILKDAAEATQAVAVEGPIPALQLYGQHLYLPSQYKRTTVMTRHYIVGISIYCLNLQGTQGGEALKAEHIQRSSVPDL